ncbi:CPBP family intramembrane metalloprotease [Niastella caeni]|uniref:CPBP family intramembrane metalloprotease n=1 Tax=Niastella caeni TaxID=2569763 RepID=A0A4S8I4M7_9BACT|nr:type II CAAX endopeptidase family protein [Niastella caeni]THU41662.1 CPBP family intramembrane metalloprotease [Niastella caeni]
MRGHLRLKSPLRQMGLFLGLFCLLYIFTGVFSIIVYKSSGIDVEHIEKVDWNNNQVIAVFKIVQALSSVLLFVLPVYIFARFTFTGNYRYFLGFRNAEKANMYVLAVVGILLALPFVFWLGDLNQKIPLPDQLIKMEEQSSLQMAAFLKIRSTLDIVINVFIIALLPAICEELFFRSVLQRIIIQIARNPWAGIVITAVLFSSLHMQFLGFLPRMFLGIVLGAFYWFSGSIWTSIIAHFVNNAAQVMIASYVPKYIDKNPETPVLVALVCGIVVWAILWYFQKQSTITFSKVYNTDELTPTNQFMA